MKANGISIVTKCLVTVAILIVSIWRQPLFACPSCQDYVNIQLLSQEVENVLKADTPPPKEGVEITPELEAQWLEFFKLDQLQTNLLPTSEDLESIDCEQNAESGPRDFSQLLKRAKGSAPYNIVFVAEHNTGGSSPFKEAITYLNQSDSEVDVFRSQLLAANGEAQINSILSQAGKDLDFQQKIKLVSKLGGDFGSNYDYDRLDKNSPNSEGIVTIEELVSGIQNHQAAGVCRDIATAQATMLEKMGVKNTFVVAYANVDGAHAALVTQDPDDESRLVKINYGSIYQDQSQGSLQQDHFIPDAGMNFRIYRPDGTPVAKVPSAMGTMLRKSSAVNVIDNPLASMSRHSINSISAEFPGKRGDKMAIRGFYGTANGHLSIYGISMGREKHHQAGPLSITNKAAVTGAAFKSQRTVKDVDGMALYMALATEVDGPTYRPGGGVEINLTGSVGTELMVGRGQETAHYRHMRTSEGMILDGSVEGEVGVEGSWKSPDGRTRVQGAVKQHFYLDTSDVRRDATTHPDSITLVSDYTRVDISGEYDMIPSKDISLYADSMLLIRQHDLGSHHQSEFGVKKDQSSLYYRGRGSLDGESPIWVPGSVAKHTVGLTTHTGKKNTGIDYKLYFENDGSGSKALFFGIQGRF